MKRQPPQFITGLVPPPPSTRLTHHTGQDPISASKRHIQHRLSRRASIYAEHYIARPCQPRHHIPRRRTRPTQITHEALDLSSCTVKQHPTWRNKNLDQTLSSNRCFSVGFHATLPPTLASEHIHHCNANLAINASITAMSSSPSTARQHIFVTDRTAQCLNRNRPCFDSPHNNLNCIVSSQPIVHPSYHKALKPTNTVTTVFWSVPAITSNSNQN